LFGSDQRAAEEILRAKGFSPGHIKPVALGEAGVRAQALRSGVVEAAAVSSPFDLTLKQMASESSAGRRISSSLYLHRVWRFQRVSCSKIRSW